MLYEEYEDIIIERARMLGIDVSALPYVEALNDPRPTAKPQVYIMYNGSSFSDPENIGATVQRETLNFEIFIKARSRRGERGVFAVSEEIKGRLMGWKPDGAITPVAFTSFGYVTGVMNNWQYMMTFTFDRYAVQRDFSQPERLIKKITPKID